MLAAATAVSATRLLPSDSYNNAKYLIIGQMSYYWGISYQYCGNTETELQCAGWRVGGDGQVGWINIG